LSTATSKDVCYRKETIMYEPLDDETVRCDLCGEQYPNDEIYMSGDLVYLCETCLDKIESAPEVIRASMERIAMGNVI
jgi:hypothetical protein